MQGLVHSHQPLPGRLGAAPHIILGEIRGEGERHPANVYMMVVICSNLNNIFFLVFFDSTLFCIFFLSVLAFDSIKVHHDFCDILLVWLMVFFLSYSIFLILLCVATCCIWGNLAAQFSMFIGDFVNYILFWENRIGGWSVSF